MNNVDVAEAIQEICREGLNKFPYDQPITWGDLLTALEQYIKSEQHEILKARERKDKPFG